MEPESDQAREKAKAEKEKGNEAFNKKDFQTAIEFYNAAIKLDPACFIYYSMSLLFFLPLYFLLTYSIHRSSFVLNQMLANL